MGVVLKSVLNHLRSYEADTVQEGLQNAERMIALGARPEEKLLLMEAISSLFYIDPFDRPDLAPAVSHAIEVMAGIGDEAIPFLVEQLSFSDLKAGLNLAKTLGQMGKDAMDHLIYFFRGGKDPYARSMALYALSKVREPEVLQIFDDLLQAFEAENPELKDTAARTMGKFFENFEKKHFSSDQIKQAFEGLVELVCAKEAPVRSKAVRSLGKMVAGGYLSNEQKKKLRGIAERIIGDSASDWDRAYIVRMEAEELLKLL